MSLTARSLVLSLAAIVTGLNPATMRHKDPRSAMLVTPRWLQEHLHDPKLVLLHVGEPQMGDKPAYDAQHIPGAQHNNNASSASVRRSASLRRWATDCFCRS